MVLKKVKAYSMTKYFVSLTNWKESNLWQIKPSRREENR